MNKKVILGLCVSAVLSACSSIKKDYEVVDVSLEKKPVWVENLSKYEKSKEAESSKYKYFKTESDSINERLCNQSAVSRSKKEIAAEINTLLDSIYNEAVEGLKEEDITINNKKEVINNVVTSRLVGVENKDNYWEKRHYLMDKGAEKDRYTYRCYNLSRVKRSVHDGIVNEMINRWTKEIKDPENKDKVYKALYESAKDNGVNVE